MISCNFTLNENYKHLKDYHCEGYNEFPVTTSVVPIKYSNPQRYSRDIKHNRHTGRFNADTHSHTYLHTCLNTSPFPCQASLVSTLWSCRLLVYWCKLAGRGPSEEQRAWQRRGRWVLLPLHPSSSSSIHSRLYLYPHPPLPVKECFQLDSPGRTSQVISWTSEGLKLGLLVHLQKLLIKKNMCRLFLSDVADVTILLII